jgi:hypothetical protein
VPVRFRLLIGAGQKSADKSVADPRFCRSHIETATPKMAPCPIGKKLQAITAEI